MDPFIFSKLTETCAILVEAKRRLTLNMAGTITVSPYDLTVSVNRAIIAIGNRKPQLRTGALR